MYANAEEQSDPVVRAFPSWAPPQDVYYVVFARH